jgi:hypothetical protein
MVALVVGLCALGLVAAASAGAEVPELGRCAKVEGVKEGRKTVYHGKYKNKTCTKESSESKGKYEWSAGPGTEKSFESPGTLEPATLETVGGKQIACKNSKQFGAFSGAKTETTELSLYECVEVASNEPCQSVKPEEVPPTPEPGTIISRPLQAELGLIRGGSKAEVGWDYKPKMGSDLFVFECGKTVGTGTQVSIEGSFIGRVKIIDRMVEENKTAYTAAGGHQVPEMFEGGAKDTLTANFLTSTLAMSSEQIGYSASEEQSFEAIEIKAVP